MADMIAFCQWFFMNLCTFLLSEPIKYFVGLFIMCFILKVICTFFSGGFRGKQ